MAKPLFCRQNLVDDGTLSASTSIGGLPPSNLQEDDIRRVWRASSGSSSAHLIADLTAQSEIGAVAMPNTNLGLTTPVRVRLSTADPNGVAGDAYDSGSVSAACDPAYRLFVHIISGGATGRYLRIDMTVNTAEAGRLVAGPTYQTSRNLSLNHPIEELWNDRSRITQSLSGVRWIDREEIQRGFRATFNGLDETEVRGQIAELNRLLGINRDFLFIRDPNSDNLGRDSIWGHLEEPLSYPVLNRAGFYDVGITVWNRL